VITLVEGGEDNVLCDIIRSGPCVTRVFPFSPGGVRHLSRFIAGSHPLDPMFVGLDSLNLE